MSRPAKPFSKPSWIVGRDFPDPNTRLQGTVPSNPARLTQSIPIPPAAAPTPTPPLYPDEGRAAAPPSALPPPAPPQSATPPAPTPAAEAPPQQPPSPNPP